jgi:outer membrane protein OmpA-like peptidoglycan-associated protein
MRSRALLAATALLITGIFAPVIGSAQSPPSPEQIIKSLTPIRAPTPTDRGIRVAPTGLGQAWAPPPAQPHAAAPTREVHAGGGLTWRGEGEAADANTALDDAAPAISLTVQFANGSAGLTPQAVQVLDNLGKALSNPALSGYMFRIEGHTDTVGSAEYNNGLSDRRANAVADYVANNFHVDRGHLEAIGMGKDGLLVPTPDQTPESRNRRVQVVNVGSR